MRRLKIEYIYVTVTHYFQIRENDEISQIICFKCAAEITRFYDFRQKAINAEEYLKNKLKQEQNIDTIPIETEPEIAFIKIEQLEDTPISDDDQFDCRDYSDNISNHSNTDPDPIISNNLENITETDPVKTVESEFVNKDTNQPEKEHKGFICDTCGKTFKSKSYIKHHILKVHKNQKNLVKKESNSNKKNSKQNNSLKTDEKHKSKLCSICGKSFNTVSSYTTHYKKHFPELCVKCSYCDKVFTNKSLKNIHERTHTGEKPYQCKICDFRCITSSWLKVNICYK